MSNFFSRLFNRISNIISPNRIDSLFLKDVEDEIIINTLKKWEEEYNNQTPDMSKLIGYADDIHIRLLELNICSEKVNEVYDKMFKKINKLHNETH